MDIDRNLQISIDLLTKSGRTSSRNGDEALRRTLVCCPNHHQRLWLNIRICLEFVSQGKLHYPGVGEQTGVVAKRTGTGQ